MATKASPDRLRREWVGKLLWPAVALALLLVFNLAYTEGFFRLEWKAEVAAGAAEEHLFGMPIDILKNGSLVMLLSLGMTLVIATGGVDLSVGAVMAISGAVAAALIEGGDASLPAWLLAAREHVLVSAFGLEAATANAALILTVALAAALGVCMLAGAWNGLLVSIFRVQPLVATLVLMVAGRGVAMLITEGRRITIRPVYVAYEQFVYIGNGFLFYLPLAVTIVGAMLLGTALLTRKTALGMFIESVGDNDTASRYSGVNARGVKFMVYVFSGLCAGIAGLIYASNIRTADASKAGLYLELDAIMAVVIGGTALTGGRFFLIGSIVGALLIQTLTTTMLIHGLSSDQALVPKALVVVAVCLLQSAEFRRRITGALAAVRRVPARRERRSPAGGAGEGGPPA